MNSGRPSKKFSTASGLKPFAVAGRTEAGCDEAGRGCLAGPVFAAAVILPEDCEISGLNDSKQLSEKSRESMREIIEQKALAFAVAHVDNGEIDRINILNASFEAMHRALDQLVRSPGAILVDGNRFRPYRDIPHTCCIGGDAMYMSIAAASVLAKTYRDAFMRKIHETYPQYAWDRNKGYPTRQHRRAIAAFGPTPYHRMSFNLTDPQLTMNFDGSLK